MAQTIENAVLLPENTARRVDKLGRITFPKGLRDRWELKEDVMLEVFTAIMDGREYICLSKPIEE